MQIMGRRAEGRPAIADYTVWTNDDNIGGAAGSQNQPS